MILYIQQPAANGKLLLAVGVAFHTLCPPTGPPLGPATVFRPLHEPQLCTVYRVAA